jgi:transposase
MEQFVGLDVSQQLTHACVIDREGTVVWRGTCHSRPEEITAIIRTKAPHAVRVGLETGPLSTWHWHALKKTGLPIICIDARHAKAALSMQANKTDRNDAFGLAQIMRAGWYREVEVKSLDSHRVRAVLGARSQLVGMRTDLRNQIRGLLKVFGVILERNNGMSFENQVSEHAQGDGMLERSLQALLAALKTVGQQVKQLDSMAASQAKESPICRHLMSIPGVGPFPTVVSPAAIWGQVRTGMRLSMSSSKRP